MWFYLSLCSVLAWAGSDLFSKKGTRTDDRFSHLRLVITVGTVMGLHAVYMLLTGAKLEAVSILRYLPVSAMYILSMTIGYAGLRYIELSVSSPVCNSSGAVAAVLCFFILGQTLETAQFIGVFMICAGILALSVLEKRKADRERSLAGAKTERKYAFSAIAIVFPILYCVIDGVGSFMDAWWLEYVLDEEQANLSYELTFAFCALMSFLYMRLIKRERFSYIRERTFALAALCETAGQFTYVYAIADNAIAAAPLISSYSVFSVLLSRIFLKEKLEKSQYAVIAAVLAGIVILGIFDV